MEDAMHPDNMRRSKNGTIDIDFYRRAAFPADHPRFAVAARSTAAEYEPRLRAREYSAASG
jgi:hypothetical protein